MKESGDITIIPIGAIFWTVINRIQFPQDRPCITVGTQKWTGAAPILNKSPQMMTFSICKFLLDIRSVAPTRIIIDPIAWMKKYLSALSEEYAFFSEKIRGTNDNKLSSNPNQQIYQEEEDTAIKIPTNKVKVKKSLSGRSKAILYI